MKQLKGMYPRLSLTVLVVMLASLVLAACGGTPATNTPATSAAPSTAASTAPSTAPAASPTSAGTGGAPTTAPSTAPTTVAQPTGGATTVAGPTGTAAGPVGTGGAGAGGNCGLGAMPPAPQAADANPDGVLVYNLGTDTENADPQVSSFVNEISVNSLVFSPLLTLDEKNRPVLNGADSCNLSADGKTYTFTIRQGMTYSDGKPVTAKDYAYAIMRSCDPKVNGNYSYVMYDIVGCQEFREAIPGPNDQGTPQPGPSDAQLQQLRDKVMIKATDDKTLTITLKAPVGYFAYIMSLWTTYPSRQDLVEKGGDRWWTKPETFVGNGPFKLVSYTPKREWVFERNDTFFRGKPLLKTIRYRIVESSQQSYNAYVAGELDINGIAPEQLPQAQANAQLKDQLHRLVLPATSYIAFNNAKKPLDNMKVRQALAAAMDRELYIKQINLGVGQPAGSFLYPGIAGYQTQTQQKFDPARAKQLLAEAGYANGAGFPTLKYQYSASDEASKRRAVFWAQQFKSVLNITVEPTPVDPVQLIANRKSRDPKVYPDMFGGGWYEDYPHPQDWVSLVFAPTPGNSLPPVGWNDKDFLALTQKADRISNIDEAAPLYAQADAMLAEKAPVGFYIHPEALTLAKPYVKGMIPQGSDPVGFVRRPEALYVTADKK